MKTLTNGLISQLDIADQALLLRHAKIMLLNVGDILSTADSTIQNIYFPLSGSIVLYVGTKAKFDSSARVAAAFEISECLAMCSTNSVLFTIYIPMFDRVQIVIQTLCSLMTKLMPTSRGFPEVFC